MMRGPVAPGAMPGATVHKQQARRTLAVERQVRVLELAKAGYTFRQIAAEVGYTNPGQAHHAFKAALKAAVRPAADEYLELELQRLDAMFVPIWGAASRGSERAQRQALALMERRAAYLGLDAPKRLAGADGGPLQLEVLDARQRLLAEVEQRRARITTLPAPGTEREEHGA